MWSPTCVPLVTAAGPGNLAAEGGEQVKEGPCLDDDVGHRGICYHHLRGVADPW